MPAAGATKLKGPHGEPCETKPAWNYLRCRVTNPHKCSKGSFRVIRTGPVKRIVCCPTGYFAHKKCSRGMKVQSVLRPKR